jgi:hypothetical protein
MLMDLIPDLSDLGLDLFYPVEGTLNIFWVG